jgi:peptidyl-prolyl cis-trans isomerase-like 4
MINNGSDMHGSQFLITLSPSLDYLDDKHTVFGCVAKGFDVLEKLNEWICDKSGRPYQDIRITHTVILVDPFEDFKALSVENGRASPEPTDERLNSDRIRVDEEVDQLEGKYLKSGLNEEYKLQIEIVRFNIFTV